MNCIRTPDDLKKATDGLYNQYWSRAIESSKTFDSALELLSEILSMERCASSHCDEKKLGIVNLAYAGILVKTINGCYGTDIDFQIYKKNYKEKYRVFGMRYDAQLIEDIAVCIINSSKVSSFLPIECKDHLYRINNDVSSKVLEISKTKEMGSFIADLHRDFDSIIGEALTRGKNFIVYGGVIDNNENKKIARDYLNAAKRGLQMCLELPFPTNLKHELTEKYNNKILEFMPYRYPIKFLHLT